MALIVGTKEYYQDLIDKANKDLGYLRANFVTYKTDYENWLAFQKTTYRTGTGGIIQNTCGRKDGCSSTDLASIQAAKNLYDNQLVLIANKEKEVADLIKLRDAAPATTAEQAAQEQINQRKNRTWVPVLIIFLIIVAIIVGIYLYRENH